MLSFIWKILKWLPGAIAGLLMFCAQVGPKEAVSHLSEWVSFAGIETIPPWLASRTADRWGFWLGLAIFITWATMLWLKGSDKKWHQPFYQHWATRPELIVWQASSLWVGQEPTILEAVYALPSANNIFHMLVDAIDQGELPCRVDKHGFRHVKREDLKKFARKHNMRPHFLFPDAPPPK